MLTYTIDMLVMLDLDFFMRNLNLYFTGYELQKFHFRLEEKEFELVYLFFVEREL